MNPCNAPTALYRLQFSHKFTFNDACAIIDYLHTLGVSHIYASPFLKARAGSSHGYNIVDHNALNPEIGSETEFNAFVARLHAYRMGLIIDFVPNHMGVGGDDNAWWLHVLENGESSVYAAFFDIDWHPANPALNNKILLPFLGDHFGAVLENGELKLEYDREKGAFAVRYYDHLFPIDPRTYPQILQLELTRSTEQNATDYFQALAQFIAECKALPRRTELSHNQRERRHQGVEQCKQRLIELCRNYPEIYNRILANVACFNGDIAQPSSFNRLHHLLEIQAYRLSYWKVATEEINYRRFFDVNELAAVRMENTAVFDVTHQLLRRLIHDGQINGIRIDHPDGLTDPCTYYHQLQKLIRQEQEHLSLQNKTAFCLWIEKILANFEHLPADWPVSGTTGYDAAFLLNGIFVRQQSERQFNRLYNRFMGFNLNFENLLYDRKKLVIHHILSSELTALANLLNRIAQTNRHTRDFTFQALRTAISEVVAFFPVYRTYITNERISEIDLRYLHWAIARAKKNNPLADTLIFDFIERLLTMAHLDDYSANIRRRIIQFVLKFQQYTAPVMAKSLEDTTFYIYNRLVSLNDVGFNTCAFGISVAAFHQANKQRSDNWPYSMVTTSTHDSKRSEDVRSRINVLSEMPKEWQRYLSRWNRLNRSKKRLIDNERAPSRNDEYLIYQTLIGAWPLEELDSEALQAFHLRIEAYMLKAVREAKLHTSWINPNNAYEEALCYFIKALFEDPEHNAFLTDFLPFQQRIARYGLFNSLSHTLLKLTVPGIPDIYQGAELWTFNLVDPDNRQPVDYNQRRFALQTIIRQSEACEKLPDFARQLLEQIDNGHAKLYLTWRTLMLRSQYPQLFEHGKYVSLAAQGAKADHVCAFARLFEETEIIAVAVREFTSLMLTDNDLPIGHTIWEDTMIKAPENGCEKKYRNVFTNEEVSNKTIGDQSYFYAADILNSFSVGLLVGE